MKYWLILSFLLVACGPSEKKGTVFGDSGRGVRDGICPANYAPLPLFRDGFTPLPGPDSLPPGTYRLTATEVYLNAEREGMRAHFSEAARAGEVIFRKICTSEAPAREILSVEFPGLREFAVGETTSHRPGSVFIQLEKGAFNFTKLPAGAIQPGGIAVELAKWGHSNIYKLSESEFELRFYTYESVDTHKIEKRMALRFSFLPSAKP